VVVRVDDHKRFLALVRVNAHKFARLTLKRDNRFGQVVMTHQAHLIRVAQVVVHFDFELGRLVGVRGHFGQYDNLIATYAQVD
jgi:hypothetical protein